MSPIDIGGIGYIREVFRAPSLPHNDRPTLDSIRKLRVTVEVIDEPHEVLRERVREVLSAEAWNHHRTRHMTFLAKSFDLVVEAGRFDPKRGACAVIVRDATEEDRARWAKEDAEAKAWAERKRAQEEAKRQERNRRARERRAAKKAGAQ